MTDDEVNARKYIALERYINTKRVEVKCRVKMVGSHFIPSAQKALFCMNDAKDVGMATQHCEYSIKRVCELHDIILKDLNHKGTLEEVCTAEECSLPTHTEMLFQQCSDR